MRLSLHTNVLDAYRADLAQGSCDKFSSKDQDWLILASLLERAIVLPENERRDYLSNAGKSVPWLASADGFDAPTDPRALLAPAQQAAESAEEHGAFAVATLLLDLLRTLATDEGDREFEGRLAYQQARVLRKLGDIEAAEDVLIDLQHAGDDTPSKNLQALAHIGLGAIARVRGNFPAARQHFGAAAVLADDVDPSLHIGLHAHHGILVAAAVARDFDLAIRHGAAALQYAEGGAQRAEILTNLASALMDAGQVDAALHGFLRAMAESPRERIRMAAVGGAAICSARLGNRSAAYHLIQHAELLIASGTRLVHETAELCRELYVASALIGDQRRADGFKHRAETYARKFGYYEILHLLETTMIVAPRPVAPLSDAALGVATELNSLDAESMLATATDIPLRE